MVMKECMAKLLLLIFIYLFSTNIDLVPIEINMEAILCSVALPNGPTFFSRNHTIRKSFLGLVLLSSCLL